MEWFSRVDDGDVVGHKGLDGLSPSSDSWSHYCDSTPFGNFKSEMKRNNLRSYVGAEDCKVTENGLSNDMKHFGISEEPFDNAASQDSYCDMDPWSSYPSDQLDFHLDNMTSIDQLDDVFLSSLLEDGPAGMDACDESSDLSTDTRCSMLLDDDDQARDEHSNLEHMTSNSCAGTAQYFSAHAFASPVDCSQEVNSSYLLKKFCIEAGNNPGYVSCFSVEGNFWEYFTCIQAGANLA
ncbi:hypothetical protein RND71_040925 [Anisodus tanguticus]|uniref:Uncharacterized protein n=1 Tax=Anisodus tanguticus TaxID=243964 RepID=A0AAE1QTS1_9SOLA|nr:hypothetical protein RND71_040925 [Anisodus tanguticus]